MIEIAIDAETGRLVGEKEPDFDYYVSKVKQPVSISQIQRRFHLSYRDAHEVLKRVHLRDKDESL